MKIERNDLAKAINLNNMDSFHATTFTMDEGVLYSLLRSFGSELPKKVCVRFDPAGFRGSDPRAVSPACLKPVQDRLFPFPPESDRNPALFHPKVSVGIKGKNARIVVSTANLAYDDQEKSANIHVALDASASKANKIAKWIRNVNGKRTLCVVCEKGKTPRVIIENNKPTWLLYKELISKTGSGGKKWLLTAPFWSVSGLKAIQDYGDYEDIKACFRDDYQAKKIVSSPRAYSKKISCLVPKNSVRFHHKVIASCTTGRECRCILYIGSANMTPAGFFGVTKKGSEDQFAWNYEAGVIFIGGKDIWKLAESAAKAGINKWRKVLVVKRKKDTEIDEVIPKNEEKEEQESILRAHLRSAIRLNSVKAEIKRIAPPPPDLPGKKLCTVSLILDETETSLAIGAKKRISKKRKYVAIEGLYRNVENKQYLVEIELPSLSVEPEEQEYKHKVTYLWRLLLSKGKGVKGRNGDKNGNGEPWLVTDDIRFPFSDFVKSSREKQQVFLREVKYGCQSNDQVGFWYTIAANLPEIKK